MPGFIERTKALISRLGSRSRILGQFITNTPWITTGRHITTDELLKRVVGDVYACAALIAAAVAEAAQVELFVRKQPGDGKFQTPTRALTRKEFVDFRRRGHVGIETEEVERVLDHPLLDLLHTINPLPFVGPYEFFEQASLYSDVARFFALIVKDTGGMPIELWTLPPGPMRPKMSKSNLIAHWEYGAGASPEKFETDEILFHRRSGPAQDMVELIMGFPPLEAVFKDADTARDLTDLLNNTIRNRGVPPMIITVQGANKEKLERNRKAWNRNVAGKQAGSAAFIPDTISVNPVGWSPNDLQHSQLLKDLRERICNAYSVPVSFFTDASSNLANATSGERKMMKFAVKPRLRRLADTLNQTLVPMFDPSGRLVISFPDPVPEDEKLTILRHVQYVDKILTSNEIRAEIGEDPLPGGDEFKKPQPMSFGGAPGGGAEPEAEPPKKQYRPEVISHHDCKDHDGPGESPRAPGLQTALVRIFRRQQAEILGNLKSVPRETKADSRPLEQADFDRLLLDLETWDISIIADTRRFIDPQISLGVANGGQQVLGLGFAFDLKPDEALEFVRTEQEAFIRQFATKVNKTTNAALREQLTQAMSAGESVAQMKKRVQGVFSHATKARAEAIARSETKRALEAGQKASYVKAGVGQMEWVAGPNACPFCQQFDGRIISTGGENFADQGDVISANFALDGGGTSRREMRLEFSDTPHPPLHPNCSCFIVPVV